MVCNLIPGSLVRNYWQNNHSVKPLGQYTCIYPIFPAHVPAITFHFPLALFTHNWPLDFFLCLPKIYVSLLPKYHLAQGWYSETGFHIGMDRNFARLWRRHNCRSQVIVLSLSALISWFMKSIIGFLNNSNLHAIISTLLIINLQLI